MCNVVYLELTTNDHVIHTISTSWLYCVHTNASYNAPTNSYSAYDVLNRKCIQALWLSGSSLGRYFGYLATDDFWTVFFFASSGSSSNREPSVSPNIQPLKMLLIQ